MTSAPATGMHQPELYQRLCDRIFATPERRITFAQFMEGVLYEPEVGYYAACRHKIGAGGDFVTSPHFGADFGELLAEQFLDFWLSLQKPSVFQIVELGAGQGLIAQDVLKYLSDRALHQPTSDYASFWDTLQYIICEKAASMRAEQRHHLRSNPTVASKVSWQSWEAIPTESLVGCIFSNELIDALPIHRVILRHKSLKEIYVTCRPDRQGFMDTIDELSTSELETYLTWLGLDLTQDKYPEGYCTEISLAAMDWVKSVSEKLKQGYVLTIDYGHTAAQYYSPQRHQGTLQCYFQQSHHSDPYWAIGYQDITTHANFTALEQKGKEVGLETLGFIQQGLFLMALGLGDRFNQNVACPGSNPMDVLQRRDALHALINPMGLGGFGVLLQGKNVASAISNYSFKGFMQ
jgi:SAM-dependent MidA family methyltransferase